MALQVTPDGMRWYLNSRFGMFIHWGLYSMLGHGEWVMHNESIPMDTYKGLAARFNPARFDADAWVSMAADAGQRWIVFTARHHEGFSMYDTALSDYKSTNSPFKRDPLRELADACARRGDVKLGIYQSILDWYHPAFRFREESGLAWDDYLAFLHGQVRELCTNYGDVCCMWFDGEWPRIMHRFAAYCRPGGSYEFRRLYDLVHTLQPGCIVINNRLDKPLSGEDVQALEFDLPGENTAGWNPTESYGLPVETCMPINDNAWGYDSRDRSMKSARRLVHVLARLAASGANLLLNVGPTGEGAIPPGHTERLAAVGRWLRRNGESIYGSGPGVLPATPLYASTRNGARHFVHVFDDLNEAVDIPLRGDAQRLRFSAARVLGGAPVELEERAWDGSRVLRIMLPGAQRDPCDTVVELTEA